MPRKERAVTKLRFESLEKRELLTVSMSDYEQLVLELVNRARANPLAEVARNPQFSNLNQGVTSGSISASAKQPLAPVQSLVNAAANHSQDMLNRDYFNHTGRNGSTPTTRARSQGYPGGVAENIAWTGSTGSINLDQRTRQLHENLVASVGHRINIMNGSYSEVGTGVRFGVFQGYNAAMVTEGFGNRQGNPYITGVVYEDGRTLNDNFYSVGESQANVQIRAVSSTGSTYNTTTGPSGGYSLAVPPGNYSVVAVGQNMFRNVSIGSINVKADFDTSQAPAALPVDFLSMNTGSPSWVGVIKDSSFTVGNLSSPTGLQFTHTGTGDFNNDGYLDVVARDTSGRLRVASGGALQLTTWGSYPNTVQWSDFHVADFTGDGRADVIARAESTGDWWLGRSTGTRFSMENWGNFSTNVQWDIHFGDFNGDGRQDVVGRAASNGSWWVGASTGSRFNNSKWAGWTTSVAWSDFRVGDFNGDGRDDIAGRARNKDWWIGESTGNRFAAKRWGSWTDTATWQDVRVGDFDGDGDDDIAGRANGRWWVATSNRTSRTFTNRLWGQWSTSTSWRDTFVFDFNDDGEDDLVSRDGSGDWWAYRSTGSQFLGQRLNVV